MCELWPKKRGKNSTAKQKMMSDLAEIKEVRAQDCITVIERGQDWKPLNQHKKLLKKQIQESYDHDQSLNFRLQSRGMFNMAVIYIEESYL